MLAKFVECGHSPAATILPIVMQECVLDIEIHNTTTGMLGLVKKMPLKNYKNEILLHIN